MASLLLDAPEGSFVSLEKLDDLAQEDLDGDTIVVQSKDCEVSNPVADRSVQMWKTFANWTRDVREGRLDAGRTTFEIYVSRKVSGRFVAAFAAAKSNADANKEFEVVRSALWGDSPKSEKRSAVAASLRPHLQEVFEDGPRAFRAIIERFQLTCAKNNPELDLMDQLRRRSSFDREEILNELVIDVYGWVKSLVSEQLRMRKAPVIARDDFWRRLRGSYEKLKPGGSLPDLGGSGPTPSQVAALLCEKFITQLEIIDADEETRNLALSRLFRARTARTRWSDHGYALVDENAIRDFEDSLSQTWRNRKLEIMSDPHRTDEKLRGRLLLAKCDEHTCLVEQKTPPAYFVPGCFHELANKMHIGWHPEFKNLIPASSQ